MPSVRFWAMLGTIGKIEAAESIRHLEVAFHGAHPGKDGAGLQDFLDGLVKQAAGADQGSPLGIGVPTSAISGPMVSHADKAVLDARIERGLQQIKDQEAAWKSGGWAALIPVLEQQRAVNLSAS